MPNALNLMHDRALNRLTLKAKEAGKSPWAHRRTVYGAE